MSHFRTSAATSNDLCLPRGQSELHFKKVEASRWRCCDRVWVCRVAGLFVLATTMGVDVNAGAQRSLVTNIL